MILYLRTLSFSVLIWSIVKHTHTYNYTQSIYQNRARSSYSLESLKLSSLQKLCVCVCLCVQIHITSQHTRLRVGRSGFWNPLCGQEIFLLSEKSILAPGAHPASYSTNTGVLSREQTGRSMEVTTHLYLGEFVASWSDQGEVYITRTTELNSDTSWAKDPLIRAYFVTTHFKIYMHVFLRENVTCFSRCGDFHTFPHIVSRWSKLGLCTAQV